MRYLLLAALLLSLAVPAAALVVDEDTVWEGTLVFEEDVRVLQDVTLTITPGTRVEFSGAGLEVLGTLVATGVEFSGQSWDGLLLKGNGRSTVLTKCVIRGAKTGLTVKGGEPTLEQLELSGNQVGIEIRGKAGGSLSLSWFHDNEKVGLFVKEDSTTSVSDCRFEKNGRYGAYLYRAKPTLFTANRFYANKTGLIVAYHGSDPSIEGNSFERNEIAIQVDRAARPMIRKNLLLSNQTGLHAYRRSDPVVSGNLFKSNDVGVLVAYSSYPQVTGNDFVDNALAMKLEFQSSEWESQRGARARAGETAARTAFAGQGMRSVSEEDRQARTLDGTVNARDNWWGQSGTAELNEDGAQGNPSFLHDGRDQETFIDEGQEYPLDKVNFTPWSKTRVTEKRE